MTVGGRGLARKRILKMEQISYIFFIIFSTKKCSNDVLLNLTIFVAS